MHVCVCVCMCKKVCPDLPFPNQVMRIIRAWGVTWLRAAKRSTFTSVVHFTALFMSLSVSSPRPPSVCRLIIRWLTEVGRYVKVLLRSSPSPLHVSLQEFGYSQVFSSSWSKGVSRGYSDLWNNPKVKSENVLITQRITNEYANKYPSWNEFRSHLVNEMHTSYIIYCPCYI